MPTLPSLQFFAKAFITLFRFLFTSPKPLPAPVSVSDERLTPTPCQYKTYDKNPDERLTPLLMSALLPYPLPHPPLAPPLTFGPSHPWLYFAAMNIKLFHRMLSAAAPLLFLAAIATAPTPASAAPAGWELRNGAWVPIVQPGKDTPDAQVAQMIADLDAKKHKQVVDTAKKWIKANTKHPLMPQVLLLQGDAEVGRGNKYRALYSYEDLLNNYATSDLYVPTLEREYHIADAFMRGYKRKFLGLRILPVAEDAVELLDRIQDRQRGLPLAERAGLRVADYYYEAGKFNFAVDAYGDFLRRYPYSQYARKAEVRRAESSLANFKGVLFDFTPLYDARERLAAVQQVYPQTAEVLQVRAIDDRIYQLDGKKELEIARYYWRAGKKYASKWYYKRVIDNWPDTQMAVDAKKEMSKRFPGERRK